MSALRAHGERRGGRAGVRGLFNLAFDDDIAKSIGSKGGIEAVVSALRAQRGQRSGLTWGAKAIGSNLAVDADNGKAIG